MPHTRLAAAVVATVTGLAVAPALAAVPAASAVPAGAAEPSGREPVRFATFNASLNRSEEGELVADLSTRDDEQAATVAEIVQRVRPDVLLINEFDYAEGAIDLFRENYLEVPHSGAAPIEYPYAFVAPSNTGIPSGHDLNNDGTVGGPDDAYGFGFFPGQYGMAVLSKYPIDTEHVRTFQKFKWADMPGAMLPDDPTTPEPADWYSDEELEDVRLSSKSHWDVPLQIGSKTVHFLVSHPTPPVFDGPEDRNGKRNYDEIRFWADYVAPGPRGSYIYDDSGEYGGLSPRSLFVIAGDQNSDPLDGDSVPGAVQQLLDHPRIVDPLPTSAGAVEASRLQGGANDSHRSAPRYDTADFSDVPGPGNLRADYVLPSKPLRPVDAGVFWPVLADPLSRLTGVFPFPSSDHRLVWVDLRVPGRR
ncbi:MAG TPA: endonuclease/exonuclease/phosphatase family protein [Nocardioidaceae bacterium]|nr:endonuclease/exonuclease/phosphatase family protein [Nocardioidaceae bacterium]